MSFDLISFVAGILAGGLTGVLAGILFGLERIAGLQEKLLNLRREIDRIDPKGFSAKSQDPSVEAKMKELHEQLDSIHEDIRRMYRKTTH